MALPVYLNEVVGELEAIGSESEIITFLNFRTGEIYGGTRDQLLAAEDFDLDDPSQPAWLIEMNKRLRDIPLSNDWLELPKPSTQEDYERMESFCFDRCEPPLRDRLLDAITGSGAFRRFREMVSRNGVMHRWFAYRRERIVEDAKAWLEGNAIPYTDDVSQAPLPKT
jgi:hypothetical protein